uniref:Ig-like domain-containing protein n=1 Tax=Suricata suricatta TaxID=37032 RepID=A0A673VNF2_SURSU
MLPPPLLLPLLWAGEWAGGRWKPEASAESTFSTGFQAQERRYWLRVRESLTVQEGLCVYVPCQFFYPPGRGIYFYSTHGYWFRKETNTRQDPLVATSNPNRKVQLDAQGRFHLLGDLQASNCSLDIRDAQRRDSGTYFFRVEKEPSVKYSYLQNQISVHVTALTHTPDILIPETLESGRPGNLTCSVPWACERGTPPIFSWMSAALTSLGPRTHLSSVLTLTPRPQDHGTNLTCQVLFPAAHPTPLKRAIPFSPPRCHTVLSNWCLPGGWHRWEGASHPWSADQLGSLLFQPERDFQSQWVDLWWTVVRHEKPLHPSSPIPSHSGLPRVTCYFLPTTLNMFFSFSH